MSPSSAEAEVVVVGAGFAGLVAARELSKRGASVLVVEARDRVGGRVHTVDIDGVAVDVGGQWTGPGQDRINALADEMGVRRFPTWPDGAHTSYRGGALTTYTSPVPDEEPEVMGDTLQAIMTLDEMAKQVPDDAPWDAPRALEWDSTTFQAWLDANVARERARENLVLAIEAVYAVEPHDLSLLHMLWYAKTGKGLLYLISTEAGAQAERMEGGMQQIAERVAEGLGDTVHLSQPVQRITQDGESVVVEGDGFSYRGKRAVITVPPALAARIDYRPAMSPLRDQLTQRAPMGCSIKCQAIYETPFWRDEGLSGRAVSDCGPVKVVFDNSPVSGSPGILMGFLEGGDGRQWAGAPDDERRRAVLDCFVRYFGDRAGKPLHYVEGNWPADEYSRGCYGAVFPAGTWVSCGKAVREPVGRLHWAGTETATVFPGYIDGAVRSGERVATELLEVLG